MPTLYGPNTHFAIIPNNMIKAPPVFARFLPCTMKRTKVPYHFVDLEAREADEEDDDDDDDDVVHQGFLVDDADILSEQTPADRRFFVDIDENSNRGAWTGLVASIEEQYASGSGREKSITEGNRREEDLDPAIAAAIYNITRQPVNNDDPLRRVRCKRNPPQAGKWVQVLRGTYKCDVGYVLSTTSSEAHLLLIPRLPPPNLSPQKRKRSESFPPALFNHETVKQVYNMEPIRIQDNIYSFRNERFEHGLIIKSYNTDSLSTALSTMPLESFSRFRESGHPKLTAFLRPSEWCLAEGDAVYVVGENHPPSMIYPSTFKSGTVYKIWDDLAELETDEGLLCVPWFDVCKVIRVGDFVEVTGGMHKGQRGWVDEANVYIQVANIVQLVDEEKPTSERCETFQVNLNVLRHTTVPMILGKHPTHPSTIPRFERAPWIGTEIVVTRGPAKGYLGVVKDVICHQATPSGLRLVIEITSLDPNAPFRRLIVDYDDVVEARQSVKLHRHAPPRSGLFMPRTDEPPTSLPRLLDRHPLRIPGIATPATPIPDSCLPSSPAWDPSSRTPQPNFASPSSPPHPVSPIPHAEPQHVLLDARLVNVTLKVVADGGQFKRKELSVCISSTDGRLSIRRPKYNTLEYLEPEWVTPKYPNAKRENGLLIVIKGEHFGKFARRIYHRFVEGGEEAIAILAFVDRVAGQADTLTGDQSEMDASHLCVCEESIDDRKRNDVLMRPLREEARKKRAK